MSTPTKGEINHPKSYNIINRTLRSYEKWGKDIKISQDFLLS